MTDKQKPLNGEKASVANRVSSSEAFSDSDKGTTQKQRPWGSASVLEEGTRYKIKRVEVKPGHRLSLQTHQHRNEHWIVVSGTAKVICGSHESFLATNQSTYIPACTTHRLENPGTIPLVLIEVQSGEYLGEDDIVRLQSDYDEDDFSKKGMAASM
ncbi:Mannose-6-phosphate isomerase [Synechococcus sp. PCC 7335]|uniref:phosphomannose isomerase type II C-terminal cupin domain n=1 Tax=Synechococcus sp. (strain ATCC 29403 / PCC 7335) TaxID=91464 RepID=UPI00017EC73D|nr:phosphomannose isomerase type II C-terminal cupin domain [Synechococcus sp. PCC 7335]EDX85197.1 Mannose-6-phosphate isomerase [Synechococcus sp. PCC 7335]